MKITWALQKWIKDQSLYYLLAFIIQPVTKLLAEILSSLWDNLEIICNLKLKHPWYSTKILSDDYSERFFHAKETRPNDSAHEESLTLTNHNFRLEPLFLQNHLRGSSKFSYEYYIKVWVW